MVLHCKLALIFATFGLLTEAFSPRSSSYRGGARSTALRRMADGDAPAGSFFNEVPNDDDDDDSNKKDIDERLSELLRDRRGPPKAAEPSTIGGIPTSQAGKGFGTPKEGSKSKKPFVGIGPPDNRPVNDLNNPEYDDQGYMLYADEETGKKSRVFEALVEYPSIFTMKIVGANEGTFVEDMVQVVADSCDKDVSDIDFKTKNMGKWTSVTVEAPVENAEMLYALYENVDKDPRVKFKF